MFDFHDQVIVITGAAGSLGQATVNAFAGAGARLVLIDRHTEMMEERFPDLAAGDDHLFTAVDLTDSNAAEALLYEVVQQVGQLDVLVNIAGGFRSGAAVHETSTEMWDFMMDLNARTVLNTARAVVPHMWQQQRGKVINIAARAALSGSKGIGAYVASKSAVMRLTETMAAELKERGINVNCILPGTIDTPANRRAMPDATHEKWVPPAAIADVILFLASDGARAVHGACIPVYGLS